MAASKPTNLLSSRSHFLHALSIVFGTLDIRLGCFPLDKWHLSATVELLLQVRILQS